MFLRAMLAFTSNQDVNNRFIAHNALHKTINKRFARLLSSVSDDVNLHNDRSKDRCPKKNVQDTQAKSAFDRYPIFVLNLSCPPTEFDMSFDQVKTHIEFKVNKRSYNSSIINNL